MTPTEEDRFADAERLWASGDPKGAARVHIDLTRRAQNPELRLRSALVLVERLNPAWNMGAILEACSIGMDMANKLGESPTKAYLMSIKAKNLAMLNGSLILERKNLKLAPGWLAFSLERDEQQYRELTARIEANDEETDRLARDGQKESGDQGTLGHVLLSVANISFQRYLSVKLDGLRKIVPLPSFIGERLKSYALDERLWYDGPDRKRMRKHLKECECRYSEAVAAFRATGDELNVAYASYAAANDLRSANRFRKAKRYLRQAETISTRHKNTMLQDRIAVLKERIRQRNRNVPNYAAGEGSPDE
jgi:hypothetical protein